MPYSSEDMAFSKAVLVGFYARKANYSDAAIIILGVELADILLGVGRRHVDGNVDAAVHSFRLLSVVDGVGSEVLVQYGQVLLASKTLILERLSLLFLQALVDHAELNDTGL